MCETSLGRQMGWGHLRLGILNWSWVSQHGLCLPQLLVYMWSVDVWTEPELESWGEWAGKWRSGGHRLGCMQDFGDDTVLSQNLTMQSNRNITGATNLTDGWLRRRWRGDWESWGESASEGWVLGTYWVIGSAGAWAVAWFLVEFPHLLYSSLGPPLPVPESLEIHLNRLTLCLPHFPLALY